MSNKSATKIELANFDELFETEESRELNSQERVQDIEISKLVAFSNHPFMVLDEQLGELMESIEEQGILVPIIARPKDDETFEILVGHRRKRACKLLGIETIPTIVRDLDDEESIIKLVDSNIQREEILPSEKAFAYKMKMEAIKRQGKRTDLTTCDQVGHKLKTRDILAQNSSDSGVQIQRYIRLTELSRDLLDLADSGKSPFTTAVELSYLDTEEQEKVYNKIEELGTIPSKVQAVELKNQRNEKPLDESTIEYILSNAVETSKPLQVTLKKDKLKKYFTEDYTQEKIEKVIIDLLENWLSNKQE